jgi:hypothetical protein
MGYHSEPVRQRGHQYFVERYFLSTIPIMMEREITMDSFAFGITLVAAAALLGVVIHLIRERIADMEESGKIAPKVTTSDTKKPSESEDLSEYNEIDCFDDCMRAFRWRPKEEVECARACGLNQK